MKTTLRWTLSAGFALASGLTGFSHTVVVAASENRPTITIHVRNYAGVAPQTLKEAEKVATGIYRKAGVDIRWADVPLAAENGQLNSARHQTYSLADIQLNILPDDMVGILGLSNSVMGLAPGTGPDRRTVYVFNGKVRTLYWRMSSVYINGDMDRFVSMGQVLGHAIAHEVGHLLLNQQVHSPHGIMRGEWSFVDFRDMTCGLLLFTPQQAEYLRAEVRSRNTRQEAVRVPALESPALQAQSEIRFRLVRDSIIVVSMMADKEGPFDFVLDTGADTTIVDASFASKLSLKSSYRNVAFRLKKGFPGHIPISPFLRPYPIQVGDYFRLARQPLVKRAQVPRPAKQPVRFATTLRCVDNRSRCTFLTLHSRNVWSAPKGTRLFRMWKHGAVYSSTGGRNGSRAPTRTAPNLAPGTAIPGAPA